MSFLPPQKQKVHWIITDKYSRIVPLFSMACFIGVATRWVFKYTHLFLRLFCTVGVFTILQSMNTGKLSKYFTTSEWTFKKYPNLLLYAIIFATTAYFSYKFSYSFDFKSYFDVYFKALLHSTLVFSVSASSQCLFIQLNAFNVDFIRCGSIGIYQRFFILARTLINTYVWIHFYYYHVKTIFVLYPYILIKIAMICYLLVEFKSALRECLNNRKKLLNRIPTVPGTICEVCYDDMEETILLHCNHQVCFNCAMHCAAINGNCPFCREVFEFPQKIEIGNGHIPFVFLLASL